MPRRTSARRTHQAPGWVWMLFGLALGLVIAAGVYVTGERPGAAPMASSPAGDRRPAQGADAAPRAASRSAATSAPGPAQPPAVDNRFDFYDILPQFEVVVPEVETGARRDHEPVSVADPGLYVLQAGSFRSHADADRMQASLALLGVESRIQRVTIDDEVFHRVRIGPLSDLDELNRIRRQLRDARIEPLLMRVAQ